MGLFDSKEKKLFDEKLKQIFSVGEEFKVDIFHNSTQLELNEMQNELKRISEL